MRRVLLTANTSWYLRNFRSGLIRALIGAGHEVTVLAPPDDEAPVLEAMGCRVVALAMDNKGTSPVRDARLLLRFGHHLRAIRPDAVLSFTIKNNVYCALAARRMCIPVLPTVSGLGTAFASGPLLAGVATRLSRAAFRPLPAVIFQNPDDRAEFVRRAIVHPDRGICVGGSGVDLARFAPVALPDGEEVVFLLIGRMLRSKGVCEFVEAIRMLRAEGRPVRGRLLGFLGAENRTAIDPATIAGWVAEGVVDYLEPLADVRPAIAAADCVVLPSHGEGLPRSLLEGAAMGRPLIATDVPGCRDAVGAGAGAGGILCAPQDPGALAAAMVRMVEAGPAGRRRMGLDGRRRAETLFDERIVIGRYLDWLAARTGAPPAAG